MRQRMEIRCSESAHMVRFIEKGLIVDKQRRHLEVLGEP